MLSCYFWSALKFGFIFSCLRLGFVKFMNSWFCIGVSIIEFDSTVVI